MSYLAFIRDTSIEPPPMDSVPVVQEFPDVFPSNLPGVPPDRDIDFAIDLEPGTKPISIPPYRMAQAELKELKDHLQVYCIRVLVALVYHLGVPLYCL